jgi:hypothetical protein
MLGPGVARLLLPRPSLFPRPPTPTQQSGSQKTRQSISLAQQSTRRAREGEGEKNTTTPSIPFHRAHRSRRRHQERRRWGRGHRRGRRRGTISSARVPRPASTISRRCSRASSPRARTPARPTPPSSRHSSSRCSGSGAPSSALPPQPPLSRYTSFRFLRSFRLHLFVAWLMFGSVALIDGRATQGSCRIRHRRLCDCCS